MANEYINVREKYYNLVIECYDKLIRLNPLEAYKGKVDIYRILADKCRYRYEAEEYYNLAIECYDKLIKLNPLETYEGKAYIYKQLNNYNSSIECYDKAIELNPNNIENYREKIKLLKELARKGSFVYGRNENDKKKYYNLAIECYDKLIKLNPLEAYEGKADIYRILGIEYYNDREQYYKLAIKCYDKAIELKPSSKLYEYKARLLDILDRRYEAEECRRKAEELM